MMDWKCKNIVQEWLKHTHTQSHTHTDTHTHTHTIETEDVKDIIPKLENKLWQILLTD